MGLPMLRLPKFIFCISVSIKLYESLLTVQLLEQGHNVFKNKRFSSFIANGPITFMNLRAVC